MHHPHRSFITHIAVTLVTLLCVCLIAKTPNLARAQQLVPPDARPAFEAALNILNRRAQLQFGETYELVDVRQDGAWAYAIAQPIAGSGLAGITPHTVVPMIGVFENEAWTVTTPVPANAAEFNALLNNVPVTLLDEQTKAFLQQPEVWGERGIFAQQGFIGHMLPAPFNQPVTVTTRDGSGHVNQADFVARPPYAGDIVATKPGKVVFVKKSSNSGSCAYSAWQQANLVVIQHAPNEFTWYVHLAYNSVPVRVGFQRT